MPVENAGSLPTLAPGVTAIYFQEAGSNAVAPAVIAQLQVYTPMYDIHNVCLVSGGARVEGVGVWGFCLIKIRASTKSARNKNSGTTNAGNSH